MMVISFHGDDTGRPPQDDLAKTAQLNRARLQQMRAYWEGLRREGSIPRRSDIDPRGIEGALEGAFVVEAIAPGVARLRIAGMTLVDLMGMEVRGMPLSALFEPNVRARLSLGVDKLFSTPAILELHLTAEHGLAKPALLARMILLPLRGDGVKVNMALGCLVVEGEFGRSPRRFNIIHSRFEALPCGHDPALARQHQPEIPLALAEAAQTYAIKPTRLARPYLRLVDLEKH